EHFLAHKFLTKFTHGSAKVSMFWAFHKLSFSNDKIILNSIQYEQIRKLWALFIKENHGSKTDPEYSRKVSEAVFLHWKDNEERRKNLGKTFSE
ncbi:hypothetical protein ABK046_45625, partial [Streptomyces caeruleatus]